MLSPYDGSNVSFPPCSTNGGSNHVNSQSLPASITSQSYSNPLPSPVTMSKESTYSIGSHSSPNQNSISSDLSQSQKVRTQKPIRTMFLSKRTFLIWNLLLTMFSTGSHVVLFTCFSIK